MSVDSPTPMEPFERVNEIVAEAVDKAAAEDDHTLTLSTGVVLNVFQANPTALIQVMSASPRPQPPTQFIQAMGRQMENPDDPDYISRVKAWEMTNSSTILSALVVYGTSLRSKPKGMPGPKDDKWLEARDAIGLRSMRDNDSWRYITWVLSVACVNDEDTKAIMNKVGKLSGVREADVTAAQEFPGSNG